MSGHQIAGTRPVRVRVEYWRLRITGAGRLAPWLGPALRGAVAGWFKDRVCRHDAQQRRTQWITCQGCPYLTQCACGSTFEYDRPGSLAVTSDLRPVALQVGYPAPAMAAVGDEVALRLVLIGEVALRSAAAVQEALHEVGRHRRLGVGQAQFVLEPMCGDDPWEAGEHMLDPAALPARAESPAGCVPRVAVELWAPLFLKGASHRGGARTGV
jgi:hypothetical protein